MTARLFAAAGLVVAAVALTGCGDEEKLYDVAGTVTFDGKPVPKGLIFFDPDASRGSNGTQGYAEIVDGKYNTADKGKGRGVRAGSYNIRLSGFDGKQGIEAPMGNALFPEHTATKEFPAANSTYDLDVPKAGKKK